MEEDAYCGGLYISQTIVSHLAARNKLNSQTKLNITWQTISTTHDEYKSGSPIFSSVTLNHVGNSQ